VSQSDAYDQIVSGDLRDPYRIVLGVAETIDVEDRLLDAGYRVEKGDDELVVSHESLPGGRCHVSCEEGGFTSPQGRDLAPQDIEALAGARQRIGVEAVLGSDWRSDIRGMATLAVRAVSEFVGMYDFDAFTFWSARWLRAVAGGRPITLSELFDVHAVGDAGRLWAHTHGLRRLGLIELELRGELDEISFEFAGKVINSAATAMHAAGLPPAETAVRIGTDTTVEWEPWETAEWDENELGGPNDRDENHSGPSGVLFPSSAEPPLRAGLAFDDNGWAVPVNGLQIFEELARATAPEAYEASRARDGRSMWVSAGPLSGTVEMFDGSSFILIGDEDGARASAPLDAVESWWVTCDSDYSLGPWKAYNLPVIEDVAAARKATYDAEGRPLCGVCGTPLVGEHNCSDA
jgi:hypothetical protein